MITALPPIKRVDSKLRELCKLPLLLPEKELSKEETEKYWSEDRKNLVECYNKHKTRIELDGVK